MRVHVLRETRRQMYWYENAGVQSLLKIPGYVFWVEAEIFLHHYRPVFQLILLLVPTFCPFPNDGNSSPVTFNEAPGSNSFQQCFIVQTKLNNHLQVIICRSIIQRNKLVIAKCAYPAHYVISWLLGSISSTSFILVLLLNMIYPD